MRRISTCLAVLGLAVLGLSATASAAPTITFKAKAVPIPGFPHTGNILGAGAALKTEFTISGTEYGGFPPPLTGVKFYGPARREAAPAGVRHLCAENMIKEKGPGACPKKSNAGPKGSASGVVSFGTERVAETVVGAAVLCPRRRPGVLRGRRLAGLDRNPVEGQRHQFLPAIRPDRSSPKCR